MKKIFTVAVMLLAGFTAFAQLNIGAGYQNEMWSAKNGDNNKICYGCCNTLCKDLVCRFFIDKDVKYRSCKNPC